MPADRESISLENRKYEVILEHDEYGRQRFYALRHGEKWRDLTGDHLIMSMFHLIQNLSKADQADVIQRIRNKIVEMRDEPLLQRVPQDNKRTLSMCLEIIDEGGQDMTL